MKKYKVIKGFYKLSDGQTYSIGDAIELNDAEAIEKANEGLIEKEEVIDEDDSYNWSEADEDEEELNKKTKRPNTTSTLKKL